MKDFPGGTWIVMEACAEKEDVPLVCISCEYNLKKVLLFLSTKAAGSTQLGEPYLAKFPDKFGDMCTRKVARPYIVLYHFNKSNMVDLHDQAQ